MSYALAAATASPFWGWRLLRTGKWRTDWAGRFGKTDAYTGDQPTLLIHAVSVGEVNAIVQLVAMLEQRHGTSLRIVVSTTTDTGFARARTLFEPRHAVVRYPLDFTRCVRRFLDAVRPNAVALVELEVWPTFVEECTHRRIPVAVINGRFSARSYGRYQWVLPLVRGTFEKLSLAAVQDEAYAERFRGMGVSADRVKVTGTMKWDTATIADDVPGSAALAEAMGVDRSKPLVVCGSTGVGEEEVIIRALEGLEIQLLIAPRKPERFDEVARVLGDPVRRSRSPDGQIAKRTGQRLFLLDTLGELRKAYALADVVIVGRTFVPQGGSDMIEPIALGKATIVGPHVDNFLSTVEAFRQGQGLLQLHDSKGLKDAVSQLLNKDFAQTMAVCGRGVILRHQGATRRHAELIEALLAQPAVHT